MPYQLSATKLQTYHRCPQAYYFEYERRVPGSSRFGSAELGKALHDALAEIYGQWHYSEPIPPLEWIQSCWHRHATNLEPSRVREGETILQQYHREFMVKPGRIRKPLGVEERLKGRMQADNLEFELVGRYDRLDWFEDGLELIDYKLARPLSPPEPERIDLQLGLYAIALEQLYGKSLRRLSLIYLRAGEKLSWDATPEQRQLVREAVETLARQLRADETWEPRDGKHCDRCAYTRYCPAVCDAPEPLPASAQPESELQLALNLQRKT